MICAGAQRIGKGFCLYDSKWADRQGRERCIKHGDILIHAPEVRGLSRKDARKKIETSSVNVFVI